ncbi:cation diffusion facilitator family transporter [Paenibacillus sp. NEAU-GSW1]|uniref:cation diffusion facilitator family transporter n=1 Tax=Paenibacillus sp. NEAU-GSW1 TaxID=2682486 RepID=UPI0012E1FAF5|nr:cation diffusion facilitator family transporter [Paenibacillus sp. NEAU-GSW1]MUT65725.1 cation diffusion facilitator family transporter [Paenibacillus sp. NEAU-GSW1]
MNYSSRPAGTFAIAISLVSNLLLTVLKITVGLLVGSQVLLADGIHNAGDVVASAAALSATIIARKPRDFDHPYGHGKAEVIGSAAVALIMAAAAIFIGYHSIESLSHPAAEASYLALIAAVISLVWKQWLYVYCMKQGKRLNNKSLIATAYDHLADVYASGAAVIGVGAGLIGDHFGIGFLSYGDPIAGLVVAYLILKLSYEMGREAVDVLMDKMVAPEKLDVYEQLVFSVPEVKRIDRIRAREHGHYIIIDVRVGVPAELNIQEGHDVSKKIKATIMDRHDDVEEVLVHLNPWYEDEDESFVK